MFGGSIGRTFGILTCDQHVDIGAELFAIASAVVYADTIKRESPERGESAYELADLFATQARRRVDDLFRSVVLGNRQEIAVAFGDRSDFRLVPATYRGVWPGLGCGGAGEIRC